MKTWQKEKLFLNNDDYYDALILEMNRAKESIDMEVFTFEDGVLGQKILECFQNAVKRGVKVRLIVDGWGSPAFWSTIGPKLRVSGVRIRVYRPLPWRVVRTRGEPRGWMQKLISRFRKLNRGFHRKITVIDQKVAWISSLNVTDIHLPSVYGKNAWLDVGGRFEGSEVAILKHAFEKAFFKRRWLKRIRRPRTKLLFLNDSFIRRRQSMLMQKRRLKWAKRRIWIQNPYFIPERGLMRAMYKRALTGIDVRVILPEKNDQPVVRWMSYAIIGKLLSKGVKIYEHKQRFVHKKVLIVDNTYTIGSNNLNHRSFFHDLEVEALITLQENQKLLERSFLEAQNESVEITLESIKKRNIFFKIFTRILFLLRYWC